MADRIRCMLQRRTSVVAPARRPAGRAVFGVMLAVGTALTAGCGQKGPLLLPAPAAASSAASAATPAPPAALAPPVR
ncbi:MAG: lipoprotein [Burkholderiaceae bacterium]